MNREKKEITEKIKKKQKKSRKKINTKSLIFYLFGLSVISLFIIIYVLPNVTDVFKQTIIIEYSGIQVKDKETVYVVRDESAYYANSDGNLEYFVAEGDQIRKNTKVVTISPSGSTYNAERRGMVSFYVDGLEGYFRPDTLKTLNQEETKKQKVQISDASRKTTKSGEALFKIINGDVWYAIFWIDKEAIVKYQIKNKVQLVLPKGNIQGIVNDITQEGDTYLVTLKFDRYYKELPMLRKIDAEIITEDYKGLTIPNESITTLEGKTGVYVKDVSGEFVFKPIKVLTSDGANSLVECTYFYETTTEGPKKVETVDIYDEVLKKV